MIYSQQNGASAPIYQQIVDRISHQVAAGKLAPGEQVPPVRELAHALDVNPMTVSKAYSILVAQGVLGGRKGARLRVTGAAMPEESRQELLQPYVEHILEIAADLGLGRPAIVNLLQLRKPA